MTDNTATTADQDAALGWPVPGWRGATPPDPRAKRLQIRRNGID